ncbi:nucleoside kinase [Porphyromonadaceae bacterium W3.11]|nr:nucleoside kinase [Porphyromonadaceae bacterium W3.11]
MILQNIILQLPQFDQVCEVQPGLNALEVLEECNIDLKTCDRGLPMIALINNTPTPLDKPIFESASIEWLGYESSIGRRVYVSTLTLLLFRAAEDLGLPEIAIEHALSNGYYGVIGNGEAMPSRETLKDLENRIQELIDENLPITHQKLPNKKAREYFKSKGLKGTDELIREMGSYYIPIIELEGYHDFILSPTLPRTGMIWKFGLEPMEKGFILRVPDMKDSSKLYPLTQQPKQFAALKHHLNLMKMIEIEDVAPLNVAVRSGKSTHLISLAEAIHEKRIANIASNIAQKSKEGVRMVLLSGPSSSGKTTTSKRISTQLITNLIWPHAISLDDYYINRVDTPLDEHGNPDYESLYALDLKQLQEDVSRLIAGEEVQLPTYNFITGEREYHEYKKMRLEENGVLIMEGIHALNPELLGPIPAKALYKIYVSALTPLSLDKHNWIRSSDNRLLRRMVRDIKYRGTSAEETIMRWDEVRRGEEKWIFPYQENADVMLNSAMLYEISALKPQASQALMGVQEISPAYPTAYRLLQLLNLFTPIDINDIPSTSLLREFLGGSSYE